MSRKRANRYLVIVVRAVVIGVKRVQAAVAPRVQGVVTVVVRVTGCDGADAQMLAVHVALAALSGGVLALASALTPTGPSELLKLAGELAVGAIAVHAAITLVRSRSGLRGAPVSALIGAALLGVARRHPTPALALAGVAATCPGRRWVEPARAAARQLTKRVVSRAALRPAKRAVPGLGQALELMSLYRTSLDSARYVHHFALRAADTYRLPAAA